MDNELPCLFNLGSTSKDSTKDEMRAIVLNGAAYYISFDCGLNDVKDLCHIHEYLMKNHNKKYLCLLNWHLVQY